MAEGAISGGGSGGVALAGGLGAVAGTSITPLLAQYLQENGVDPGSTEGHLLLTLASGAIGAGVGALTGGGNLGIDAETGGSTAANSTLYNDEGHLDEQNLKKELQKEEQALGGFNGTTPDEGNTNLFPGAAGGTNVPQKALNVLSVIGSTGGAPQGYKGGNTFSNDGRGGGEVLPTTDAQGNPITYQEWDVNPYTPGVNRGAERLVTGSNGSAYYTSDHYVTFTQIK